MATDLRIPTDTERASRRPGVVGVLLAGGAGTRFRGDHHKLLTPFKGRPLYRWGLDAVLDAGLAALIVTGAIESFSDLPDGVSTRHNPRWAEGMATTLAVAVEYARSVAATAIVVGPADQPLIPSDAWRELAEVSGPICVATYDGRRANPVRLEAEVWALLPSTGDFGARELIRMRPDLVTEVACRGNPADIDTREDHDRWNSSTNSP